MFEFFKSELCPTAFTSASLMLLAAGLLGLLLGYFMWGRFKRRITELEDDLSSLRGKLRKSEADLVDKQESFDRLDADYASLRTKNRDLEYKLRESTKITSSPSVESTNKAVKTGLTSSLASTKEAVTVTKEAVTSPKDAVVSKKEAVVAKETTGKRGRPAGSKNKTTTKAATKVKASTGKRGRPAGSKNKTTKVKATKTAGKRGRPAGSKNKTTKTASEVKATTGKRGRPAGSKNKTEKKTAVVKTTIGKRGRPAGSKNKTTKVVKATTGKRGRPAGSKNKTTGKRGRPAGSTNKTKALKTSFSAASLTAAKTVFGKKVEANDLALIEGIGPATSKLFSKNGIKSWSILASKTPDELRKILQKGGNRFQLLEPKTWPRQAKMAASAEWKKLKIYQDKLDGGK